MISLLLYLLKEYARGIKYLNLQFFPPLLSMQQVFERRMLQYSEKVENLDHPSADGLLVKFFICVEKIYVVNYKSNILCIKESIL